jgi:hypothetical protein
MAAAFPSSHPARLGRARSSFCLVCVLCLHGVVACGSSASPGDGADNPDGSFSGMLPDGGGGSGGESGAANGSDATVGSGKEGGTGRDASGSGGARDTGAGGAESGAADDSGGPAPPGAPCGYQNLGVVLAVAPGIQVCLPPVVCTPSETCPQGLGDCVAGKCVFQAGYQGLATLPQAWATEYCDLEQAGCNGAVLNPLPYDVATAISATYGPICEDQPNTTGTCVGIAAPPAMMAGNSQVAVDPSTNTEVTLWGLGMTAASGLCYQITGAGGTAVVAITDRCGGYCECGSGFNECGDCINATNTTTECPCVGTAPPLYTTCCGRTCGATGQCDWCANNNHPHFDMDNATFAHVCGSAGPLDGSCQLTSVQIVSNCYPPVANWPNP